MRRDQIRDALLQEAFLNSLKATIRIAQFMGGDSYKINMWLRQLVSIQDEAEGKAKAE